MSKKLSMNEVNLLVNVINEKISESKYEKIKGKLEKDSDYKKLEKLSKEVNELNKKLREKSSVYNELVGKVKNKFGISNVWKNGDEIRVSFWINDSSKVRNEVILSNISKELDVESMINKIVEKYS